MDFKIGDLLCITPGFKMFVWTIPRPLTTTTRLELEKHHVYFGVHLGFYKHNKDCYCIAVHNMCYLFWKHDFDFKCVTERLGVC